MCVCVCYKWFEFIAFTFSFSFLHVILYVNCISKTVFYMCIEYCVYANMYHLSAQGVDEHILMYLINKNKNKEQTNNQKNCTHT